MSTHDLLSWYECKRCALHKYRRNVVMGRGVMPADIFFIGEAPGKSEDLRGEPFVGPAGRILNQGIKKATELANLNEEPDYFITNTVACRPTDEDGGPNRPPNVFELTACFNRLLLLYAQIKPNFIVYLGKVAEKVGKQYWRTGISLRHPAYIARKGGIKSSEFKEFVRNLSDIFKENRRVNQSL